MNDGVLEYSTGYHNNMNKSCTGKQCRANKENKLRREYNNIKYKINKIQISNLAVFEKILGGVEGFLLSCAVQIYFTEKIILSVYSFLIVIIFAVDFYLAKRGKLTLKMNKKTIINSLLESCTNILFRRYSQEEWRVCAMVQVPKGKERRTPYYYHEDYNEAIHNHRAINFGDVGKAFFGEGKKSRYLSKRITVSERNKNVELYKNDVPKNLRAIFAHAIYSQMEDDSQIVIAVLEFDVFAQNSENDISDELFNEIDMLLEHGDSLISWSKAIAFLIEDV